MFRIVSFWSLCQLMVSIRAWPGISSFVSVREVFTSSVFMMKVMPAVVLGLVG